MKTLPFDLEKALNGHPLVTRDGRKVKNFTKRDGEYITYQYRAEISGIKNETFTKEGLIDAWRTDSIYDLLLLIEEEWTPIPGEYIEVADHMNKSDWAEREFIKFIENDEYTVLCKSEAGNGTTVKWKYCRQIKKTKDMEEIKKVYIDGSNELKLATTLVLKNRYKIGFCALFNSTDPSPFENYLLELDGGIIKGEKTTYSCGSTMVLQLPQDWDKMIEILDKMYKYEIKKETITIGTPSLSGVITKNKESDVVLTIDNKIVTLTQLKRLVGDINYSRSNLVPWSVTVKTVQIGCSEFTIDELNDLIVKMEEF